MLNSKLLKQNIVAVKSYFLNELRSLKLKAPVTKKLDYNQYETTASKNKIKLLELENQLLKCDVSNEQKFLTRY